MADYTKTIANAIGLFGVEVSTKWGQTTYPYTMIWGTSKWGYGTNTIIYTLEKYVQNTQALTPSYIKNAQHIYETSQTLDSSFHLEHEKNISNSMSLSQDMYSEKLSRGNWNYIFPPQTTEGENRSTPTWSEASQQTTSFSCLTAASTTWT